MAIPRVQQDLASWTPALEQRVPIPRRKGTYRTCDPAETLARVRPFARRMGVTRIGNITGLDHIGIPVATAIRPNSRSVSVSLGKGLSLEQAMTSALMEAAENFHGEELSGRFRYATHRELAARAAVAPPSSLPRSSKRFDDDTAIPWIEGFDLLRHEPCWVPAELVHTDCTIPAIPGSGYFLASSNGLAAGNHPSEALVAALCEVIERDAVALWKGRRLRARARCGLDLASVNDAHCQTLLQLYSAAGMIVRLWNITSDIGVPAFICDIRPGAERNEPLARRFRGAACHPDRAIALAGALTEAAQTRLTYISGARDDLPPEDYNNPETARISDALIDAFAREVPGCELGRIASLPLHEPDATVPWLLECLAAAGCWRAVAVNLTHPEIGIPVVRVLIPGLESPVDDPRYQRGTRGRTAAEAAP